MRIVIIEDEMPSRELIKRLVLRCFPGVEIDATLDSVESSVEYFSSCRSKPDLVFMDVELSDGYCFDIIKRVPSLSDCAIIITTAYETYALEAFRCKCLDYLLKPIGEDALRASVERVVSLIGQNESKPEALSPRSFREKFVLKRGTRIEVVETANIAFFCCEDKASYIVCKDGGRHLIEQSLDSLMGELNPNDFIQISRAFIVSRNSVSEITNYTNSRLRVSLLPGVKDPVIVPRSRVRAFMDWLEK